jgi:hypothetical protein
MLSIFAKIGTYSGGASALVYEDSGMKGDSSMEGELSGMMFNVIVKKEADQYLAHCLELDIVATWGTESDVLANMVDLIAAQVDYAFSNDNLDNLFRPAPRSVWEEFYTCSQQVEMKIELQSKLKTPSEKESFIPPWIIAKTCRFPERTNA